MPKPQQRSLRADRRAAVSVMFATAAMPMLGLIGLGIDFGFYNQARSQLQLAADAAAVNAAKIAGARYVAGDAQWQQEAVTSGTQWFAAQLGTYVNGTIGNAAAITPTIAVPAPPDGSLTFTATVNYRTAMTTFIARLFGVSTFGLSGQAAATITETVYSELLLMLDNSSSMEIGATNADIQQIQGLVPCDKSAVNSGQSYGVYSCSGYTGGLACPITSNIPAPNTRYTVGSTGPACTNLPKQNGKYITANAPCAFACHWDGSQSNQNNANDYYGAVRRASAAGSQIALRFDIVQQAVSTVLTTAQQLDIPSLQNISVGVTTFNNSLNWVYPTAGEATDDLADAPRAVADIPPWVSGNNPNTNFPAAMQHLISTVAVSGDGSSSASPKKSLILVTDGLADYDGNGRFLGAFDSSLCNTLKSAPYGFTIYVLYTPYDSLMNSWYVQNVKHLVEGTSPTPVEQALQACASNTQDYYEASDLPNIEKALGSILRSATKTAVRFIR